MCVCVCVYGARAGVMFVHHDRMDVMSKKIHTEEVRRFIPWGGGGEVASPLLLVCVCRSWAP